MAMIYEDTLQQIGKHVIKNEWWGAHGVEVVRTRFDGNHDVPVSFGDYYAPGSNIVCDTKRNIAEIAKNINGRNHDRFKRECQRAQREGYRLVILVENRECIHDLLGVTGWTNDHCRVCGERKSGRCIPQDASSKCPKHGTRKPIQGSRLAKAMRTMSDRYGVDFRFCDPRDSARIICELMGVDYEQDAASSS